MHKYGYVNTGAIAQSGFYLSDETFTNTHLYVFVCVFVCVCVCVCVYHAAAVLQDHHAAQ